LNPKFNKLLLSTFEKPDSTSTIFTGNNEKPIKVEKSPLTYLSASPPPLRELPDSLKDGIISKKSIGILDEISRFMFSLSFNTEPFISTENDGYFTLEIKIK